MPKVSPEAPSVVTRPKVSPERGDELPKCHPSYVKGPNAVMKCKLSPERCVVAQKDTWACFAKCHPSMVMKCKMSPECCVVVPKRHLGVLCKMSPKHGDGDGKFPQGVLTR